MPRGCRVLCYVLSCVLCVLIVVYSWHRGNTGEMRLACQRTRSVRLFVCRCFVCPDCWVVFLLGFDAAVNYKTTKNLYMDIKKACPKGIDVFFDNGVRLLFVLLCLFGYVLCSFTRVCVSFVCDAVGGQTLDIALAQLR